MTMELDRAKRIAHEIIMEGTMVKQTWLGEYNSNVKMLVVPMDVLSTLLLNAED